MPRFCFALNLLQLVKPFVGFAGCLAIGPAKPRADFTDYSVATHTMFEGKITWISPFTPSKKENGKFYRLIRFEVFGQDRDSGYTNVVLGNRNYPNWENLKVGSIVKNLLWKQKEEGLIDADSPVEEV